MSPSCLEVAPLKERALQRVQIVGSLSQALLCLCNVWVSAR